VIDLAHERDPEILRQVAQLQDREIGRLISDNARLREENARLRGQDPAGAQQELELMKELLAQREQALFGRSSEKRPRPADGVGGSAGETAPAKAPRRGHGPRPQPSLPVVEELRTLPEDQLACPACGGTLAVMAGQSEDSEEITVVERQFLLKTIKRQKYRCRCNGAVVTAPAPPKLIPGGRYSPELAVHIAVAKYADHLPLERQVAAMARVGLEMTSQTAFDQLWVLHGLLRPSYDALGRRVLGAEVIGGDETRWPLLSGKTSAHYVWGLTSPEVAFYRVAEGRSKEAARVLLGSFSGVLMADGYSVYASLARESSFVLAHCWAHVRRKFHEAQPNAPQAAHALDLIGQLYAVEREAPPLDIRAGPEAQAEVLALRRTLRGERSRAIVHALRDWACETKPAVLPQSGLGKAIEYMLSLWVGLTRFLDDPRVGLDNNPTERALRGVVVGRKNHYGSKSLRGCQVAALFYTLIESAKLVGVDPHAYLLRATHAALAEPGTVTLPADLLD
jgi:transposase